MPEGRYIHIPRQKAQITLQTSLPSTFRNEVEERKERAERGQDERDCWYSTKCEKGKGEWKRTQIERRNEREDEKRTKRTRCKQEAEMNSTRIFSSYSRSIANVAGNIRFSDSGEGLRSNQIVHSLLIIKYCDGICGPFAHVRSRRYEMRRVQNGKRLKMRSTFIILTNLEDITRGMAQHGGWKVTSNCGMTFNLHYNHNARHVDLEDLLLATKRKTANNALI